MKPTLRLICVTSAFAALSLAMTTGCGDDEGDTAGTGGAGTGGTATGGSATGGGDTGGAATGGAATGGAATGGGAGDVGNGGGGGGVPGSSHVCTTANDPAEDKTCADYCTIFMAKCNTAAESDDTKDTYSSAGDCVTQCLAFLEATLCCRIYHVDLAADEDANSADRIMHCRHAKGELGQCE